MFVKNRRAGEVCPLFFPVGTDCVAHPFGWSGSDFSGHSGRLILTEINGIVDPQKVINTS